MLFILALGLVVVLVPALIVVLWACMATSAQADAYVVRSDMLAGLRSCRACIDAEAPCSGDPYKCAQYIRREVL